MTQTDPILYIGAYLPRLSETFVYREVLELSRTGWTVHTASLHQPDVFDEKETALRQLAQNTTVVSGGWPKLIVDALAECVGHPLRALRTLLRAGADGCFVKSTWFERATMCLVVEDVERDDDYDLVTYDIVKNKESGVHEYLDVMYDNTIGSIQSATPLNRRAFKAREDLKRKQANEDAKAQMDAQEAAQAHRRQERSALRCINGKLAHLKAEEKL